MGPLAPPLDQPLNTMFTWPWSNRKKLTASLTNHLQRLQSEAVNLVP